MHIQENVPLAPLTTLGVGGAARYFIEAESVEDVRAALAFARARSLPWLVLGGGSNLLVADRGFSGLVLKIALRGIERRSEDGNEVFTAAAGEDWDAFVAQAVAANCAGIECMSGIPGTVGATPVQNVGAYGQEVADTIVDVQALDTRTWDFRTFCNAACGFSYRTSLFNSEEQGRYIILGVTFALLPGGDPHTEYADLKKYFAGRTPTLAEAREAVLAIRASKGMLLAADDEDARSAGSFFKNPVVTPNRFEQLKAQLASAGMSDIPHWPAANGELKLSAAWLVEHAGFAKGYSHGGVGISRKHALAIVNRGGATAAEVVTLKDAIQAAVRDRFGLDLHPEPVFVGF